MIHTHSGSLYEFPPATLRRLGRTMPAGGGGYLRLLPYALVDAAFRQADRLGQEATFYIHPWEVDPGQPRFRVSWTTRIRHYRGLDRTLPRMARLLSSFRFRAIADSLPAEPAADLALANAARFN